MSECMKTSSLFFISIFCSTNAFYTTNEENIRQLSQYLDQMKKVHLRVDVFVRERLHIAFVTLGMEHPMDQM